MAIDLLELTDEIDVIRAEVAAKADELGLRRFAYGVIEYIEPEAILKNLASDLAQALNLNETEARLTIQAGALYYLITKAIVTGAEYALAPQADDDQ